MKRRSFVTATGVAAAGVCTCGLGLNSCMMITGISNTPEVGPDSYRLDGKQILLDLAKVPELQETGGSVKLEHDDGLAEPIKVLIVRKGDNEFLAIENRCTHIGCEIAYDHDLQRLRCVCISHSKFDLKGNVTDGPAHGPLTVYQTAIQGDALMIDLS